MKILQSLLSLIQYQIHQLVINFQHMQKNVRIISINGEDPITSQGAIDELNLHKPPHGKSKVNITVCRRQSYQIKDLEDMHSIFDQV